MKALTMRNTLEKFNDILIEIIYISCYTIYIVKERNDKNAKNVKNFRNSNNC